jgi:hypothetical protein
MDFSAGNHDILDMKSDLSAWSPQRQCLATDLKIAQANARLSLGSTFSSINVALRVHVPIHYQYRTYNNMPGVKTGSVGLAIELQTLARLLLPWILRHEDRLTAQLTVSNQQP